MVDDMQASVGEYLESWAELTKGCTDADYFTRFQPTAVGWKFTDRSAVMKAFEELREECDQIHFGWINERWVIAMHLKELVLPGDIRIVKLMERRPGSTDKVGLDHVDFYTPADDILQHVKEESELDWNEEKNGTHCKWISVWFERGEAKLRNDTVLQVCADEMIECQQRIIGDA